MFKSILIKNFRRFCIIWRIDIDTLHLLSILLLQQFQCLKVLGVDEQAIALLINIVDRSKQSIPELCRKEFGIEHEERIFLEEFHRQRHGIGRRVSLVAFNPVNRKQTHPLLALCIVGSNLGVEAFRHTVERHAIVGLYDKFLFQPQPFLIVLQ